MEELIEEVKHRAERVAVSSVIKRYDGRVPPSKIASYNNYEPRSYGAPFTLRSIFGTVPLFELVLVLPK
jgi:hypothetical protein